MYNDMVKYLSENNILNVGISDEKKEKLYKFYEICEYYEQYQPSKLSGDKANTMILTMAALDAGLIDA